MRNAPPPSKRVTVRQKPKRGFYDRAVIDAILDCSIICHVGFVSDDHPVVIPTFFWREGDYLYWHGSKRGRMMQVTDGLPVCITVTQLDGLVLARSAFNHSANYRSVTLFGRAGPVIGREDKLACMRAMLESIIPGRWGHLRPITDKEIDSTHILRIPITEAAAKVREGPPGDAQDEGWPVWAGVIPVRMVAGHPEVDGEGSADIEGPLLRPS